MNRSRITLLAGVVVAVVATAAAMWRWKVTTIAVLQSEISALHDRQSDLRRRQSAALERQARATAEVERIRVALLALPKSGTGSAPVLGAEAEKTGWSLALTMDEFLRRSATPENRSESIERWLASRRASVPQRYAVLFRKLNLSAEARDAFARNVMRAEEAHQDINSAAMAQGYRTEDAALGKFRSEITARYDADQRALLGEEGRQDLVAFERTTALRNIAGRVAGMAVVAGEPLSLSQAEQLILVMAAADTRKGPDAIQASSVDWDRVNAQLPSFLTAAQVKLLMTNEPPGGGMFLAQWSAQLGQAMKNETLRRNGTPQP